jgi:hypothetical protein
MADHSTIAAAPWRLSTIRARRGVVPYNIGFWLAYRRLRVVAGVRHRPDTAMAAIRHTRRAQLHHGDTRLRLHGRGSGRQPLPLRPSLRPDGPAAHHRARTRVRHCGRRGHGMVANPVRAADRPRPDGRRHRADGLQCAGLPHRPISSRTPRAAALAGASDRRLGGEPRRAVTRAVGGRPSSALGRAPVHHLLPRVHCVDGHRRDLG